MNDHEIIKKALLEAMDYFHLFCMEHGLVYCLVGGGLIGAIRHEGFIPWDDDLDVIMPKEDFERLLRLSSKFKHPLKLNYHSITEGYYRSCASLENRDVVVDTGGYANNISGVCIDVFCLHPTFENTFFASMHFNLAKLFRGLFIVKGKTFPRRKYSGLTYRIYSFLHHMMIFFPRKGLSLLLNFSENICIVNSGISANLHGAWGVKEILYDEVVYDRELYKFEGREYWSMSFESADRWLTNVYGDYMELPPLKEQVNRHIDKIVKVHSGL